MTKNYSSAHAHTSETIPVQQPKSVDRIPHLFPEFTCRVTNKIVTVVEYEFLRRQQENITMAKSTMFTVTPMVPILSWATLVVLGISGATGAEVTKFLGNIRRGHGQSSLVR